VACWGIDIDHTGAYAQAPTVSQSFANLSGAERKEVISVPLMRADLSVDLSRVGRAEVVEDGRERVCTAGLVNLNPALHRRIGRPGVLCEHCGPQRTGQREQDCTDTEEQGRLSTIHNWSFPSCGGAFAPILPIWVERGQGAPRRHRLRIAFLLGNVCQAARFVADHDKTSNRLSAFR